MKLLLAEDDPTLADALSTQLRQAGYAVEHAPNGAVADFLLERQPFDIAVLDIGLPMMDGLAVLRRLRTARPALPVLLLSARDTLDDRVAGLQAGADDYVSKPFDLPELLARLQALLRRHHAGDPAQRVGALQLDSARRRASVDGNPVDLSPREWELLELLVSQRDRVVTKDQIVQTWSGNPDEAVGAGNSIEVYIHRLRRKLEGARLQIRTVRGLGYLLETGAV